MKSRILFVGDLDDLPGSLDRMHCQWDMAFIQNGTDALETLSKGPFDVVVADMQISGITSSDFFNQISEQYPQIIRVCCLARTGRQVLYRLRHQFTNGYPNHVTLIFSKLRWPELFRFAASL